MAYGTPHMRNHEFAAGTYLYFPMSPMDEAGRAGGREVLSGKGSGRLGRRL